MLAAKAPRNRKLRLASGIRNKKSKRVRKRLDDAFPSKEDPLGKPAAGWRRKLFSVIFEADTVAGRRFDQALILAILLSLLVVMADSVQIIVARYGVLLRWLEWIFTVLFTIEYVARVSCVRRPVKYTTSFFGVIDLLAILPTYVSLFFPGLQLLTGIRVLRLLRVFRVFKLTRYVQEYQLLGRVLRASARKIMVFLSVVFVIVLTIGTVMYVVEGPQHGFTSIPTAIYWAISTITTVGFGDITPQTPLGRLLASMMMLLGWGVLAVPTGIFTMEMSLAHQSTIREQADRRVCEQCQTGGHEAASHFCKACGAALPPA